MLFLCFVLEGLLHADDGRSRRTEAGRRNSAILVTLACNGHKGKITELLHGNVYRPQQ